MGCDPRREDMIRRGSDGADTDVEAIVALEPAALLADGDDGGGGDEGETGVNSRAMLLGG